MYHFNFTWEEERTPAKRRSHDKSKYFEGTTRNHRHHNDYAHVDKRSCYFKEFIRNPERYPVRYHKIGHGRDKLKGELRKLKPPTSYGDNNKGKEAKPWLHSMTK